VQQHRQAASFSCAKAPLRCCCCLACVSFSMSVVIILICMTRAIRYIAAGSRCICVRFVISRFHVCFVRLLLCWSFCFCSIVFLSSLCCDRIVRV
jgi:hypothetical protein